ncbi:MAG: hypothetical protein CR974_00630 [Gammaproteobacteria bacterium]|nr:MAG: hypothetical protein CR974_00630 [Gammaproteobacteria bacterium]
MSRKQKNPYQTSKIKYRGFDSYNPGNHSSWYHFFGRIGRLRFISYQFVLTLVTLAIIAILNGLLKKFDNTTIGIIAACFAPILLYAGIIYPKRRLNDLEKSGWLALLSFIPGVNVIFLLYLAFAKGSEATNAYGHAPRANRWWHWLIAFVLPVLMLIGAIAATALPAYKDFKRHSQKAALPTPDSVPLEQPIQLQITP